MYAVDLKSYLSKNFVLTANINNTFVLRRLSECCIPLVTDSQREELEVPELSWTLRVQAVDIHDTVAQDAVYEWENCKIAPSDK